MSKQQDLNKFQVLKTLVKQNLNKNIKVSPMNSVFEINGNQLYLGNINAANDPQYLKNHNVGAVLSIMDKFNIKLEKSIIHLWISAEDKEDVQIISYFEQAANFIRDNLKNTNVLVHCYAGISRSSSLIIAYLMKYAGYSLKEAILKLKIKRPQVSPNKGFMEQLNQYQQKLKNYKQIKSENSIKDVSRFLNISLNYEKHNIVHQQINKEVQSYNIYNKLYTKSNKKVKYTIQQNFENQKSKNSFLDKSCSSSTSTNKTGQIFISNNLYDDPIRQCYKIKNSQKLFHQQILGMKNIYNQHGRFNSLNY